MIRNESLVGFLLEPVHSSTHTLVSGTVRSRPLAAKVTGAYSLYSVGQPWLRDDFTPRAWAVAAGTA